MEYVILKVIHKRVVLLNMKNVHVIIQDEKPSNVDPNQIFLDCIVFWIGDGLCDDFNNMEVCQFDGNDCCGDNPYQLTTCFDCECKM